MDKDVIVVERLEDIDIMNGIDFKLNQRLSKIEDNMRKEKLKTKKDQEYNNRLIKIAIILASAIIIMLAFIIFKDDDKNIDDCIAKGYTKAYCEKSIYGL